MAEYEGKLVVCSRCGCEVFLRKTGTYTLDGGYTGPFNEYEKLSEDWLKIYELGGHICPKCALKFKRMIADYMGHHRIINVAPIWRIESEETANA